VKNKRIDDIREGKVMFDRIMEFFKELNSTTLMILVFAAILVIFLIILIVVTVKVLKSNNDEADDDEYEDDEDYEVRPTRPEKWNAASEEDTVVLTNPSVASSEQSNMSVDQFAASSFQASDNSAAGNQFTSIDEDEDEDEDEDYDEYDDEEDDDTASSRINSFRSGFHSASADRNAEEALRVAESVNNEVAAIKAAANISSADGSSSNAAGYGSTTGYGTEESVSTADAKTNEIDTAAIKEALRLEREQADSQKAASDAESADYNAKMDSAFVPEGIVPAGMQTEIPVNKVEGFVLSDEAIESATEASLAEHDKVVSGSEDKITVNPVNAVNINTVNTYDRVDTKSDEAGISGMEDMQSFLSENPVPQKKKKKVKKRDQAFEEKFETDADSITTGEYFWYNSQDIDGLKRKEDMYYYCHYFNSPNKAIIPLVTEMYDCAFVRTEEIQLIAYGIQFKSMKMRDILTAQAGIGFDTSKATKQPTEKDYQEIYRKWCGYVDNFMTIIVINAPENVKQYILNALYEYGRRDVDTLLHSPE
jgi:hypothetical protein